jgi:hypothetical protein
MALTTLVVGGVRPAKAFGLTIPPPFRLQAHRVIE